MAAIRSDSESLSVRLLGPLEVCSRSGGTSASQTLVLPASRRTRALLAYLAATGTTHTRQALCDLLWDGSEDPRAALRWSLTKLRSVVDDAVAVRLVADREHIVLERRALSVDTVELQTMLAPGVEAVPPATLERAAEMLRGAFLDGIELPGCYRFHHWCAGERERLSAIRRAVLAELVERLDGEPERALAAARAMLAADPLSEAAHAHVVRLVAAAGRYPEAERHYLHARQLLAREIAAPAGGPLDRAIRDVRAALRRAAAKPEPAVDAPRPAAAVNVLPLVGRNAERTAIEGALGASASALLLFVGEPGIGKTRLLDHFDERAAGLGRRVIRGRCYEAERARPYGVWIDALRAVAPAALPAETARGVAVLLGVPSTDAAESGNRPGLFAAVADLFDALAATQAVAIVIDDLQWIDEASAALLHFLLRSPPGAGLRVAAAARSGEVDDNAWAAGLLHSLVRDQRLKRCPLSPFGEEETGALLAAAASALAAADAWRQSGGNPLYVLELARAGEQSQAAAAEAAPAAPGGSLDALIAARVEALDAPGRETLAWAAAIGHELRPDLLADSANLPIAELLSRLDRLERRGLMRSTGEGHYDFAHDRVREAVYLGLSAPLRLTIHRRIAQALSVASAGDPRLRGELARHAELGGETLLAVQAGLAAGEHCLRVFANAEALAAAERARCLLDDLPQGAQRIALTIALLKLQVIASATPAMTRGAPNPAIESMLEQSIADADALGLHAEAASGLHILSWLRQHANDTERTQTITLEAARSARQTDAATRCQQLANTARCLLEVEAEPNRARALLSEAETLAGTLDLKVIELLWGQALLARRDGRDDVAITAQRQAVALARLRDDHWREYECLVWLATLAYESRRDEEVAAVCALVARAAQRMGEARAPFAEALAALTRLRGGEAETTAGTALDAAISALRTADDKAHLAYALNESARLALRGGDVATARLRANEALAAALAVKRPTEVAVARATQALLARADGDESAESGPCGVVGGLGDVCFVGDAASARARGAWRFAAPATLASTPALTPDA